MRTVAHREEIESASAKTTSLSSAVAGVRARMDRIARGARAIVHNGSLGQLIVLLTLAAVFVGALALLASLLLLGGEFVGLVTLLLVFIAFLALGIGSMGWHLLETPATQLEFEDDGPLGMSFHRLSPQLQNVIREARYAADRIRTRSRSSFDVTSVVWGWLREVRELRAEDQVFLKERGIVLAELERAIRHFNTERADLDARALLRSFEDHVLGDGTEDPMRRGGHTSG